MLRRSFLCRSSKPTRALRVELHESYAKALRGPFISGAAAERHDGGTMAVTDLKCEPLSSDPHAFHLSCLDPSTCSCRCVTCLPKHCGQSRNGVGCIVGLRCTCTCEACLVNRRRAWRKSLHNPAAYQDADGIVHDGREHCERLDAKSKERELCEWIVVYEPMNLEGMGRQIESVRAGDPHLAKLITRLREHTQEILDYARKRLEAK